MTVTTAMIGQMRAVRARGHSYLAVAVMFGVSPSTVRKYAGDVLCERRRSNSPTSTEIAIMRAMCRDGFPVTAVISSTGFCRETVEKHCGDYIRERRRRRAMKRQKWISPSQYLPDPGSPVLVTIRKTYDCPKESFSKVYAGYFKCAEPDKRRPALWEINGVGYVLRADRATFGENSREEITGWMPGFEPYEVNENDDD